MAKAKKLPSGSWRVLLFIGTDAAGKRMYESFTADTKSEAEFLAAEYKMKHPKEKRSRMTLGEAFDSYIESKSAVLSPSTLRSYKTIRRNYLKELMPKPIDSLSLNIIQKALNKEALKLSPKTMRNINGLLYPVFKAYRPDFILNVTLPQREKNEIYIPEEGTMKRLTILAQGTNIELPLLLASQLGLRASEIAGLTYACIDYEIGEIHIKQALVYSGSDNGNVMKTPKSYSGNRKVPCSKYILDKLGEGDPNELILKTTSNAITKRWMRFMKDSGEEYFNFHALRHYFCSMSLLLGAPKKYVAEIMGHASENMINRVYEHTFKEKKQEYAAIIMKHFEAMQHEMQHDI